MEDLVKQIISSVNKEVEKQMTAVVVEKINTVIDNAIRSLEALKLTTDSPVVQSPPRAEPVETKPEPSAEPKPNTLPPDIRECKRCGKEFERQRARSTAPSSAGLSGRRRTISAICGSIGVATTTRRSPTASNAAGSLRRQRRCKSSVPLPVSLNATRQGTA
jgi:hypothetical protein